MADALFVCKSVWRQPSRIEWEAAHRKWADSKLESLRAKGYSQAAGSIARLSYTPDSLYADTPITFYLEAWWETPEEQGPRPWEDGYVKPALYEEE